MFIMSEHIETVYATSAAKELGQLCFKQLQGYVPGAKIRRTKGAPSDLSADFILEVRPGKRIAGILKSQSYLSREQVNHIILQAADLGRRTLGEIMIFARWIPDAWAEAFRKARTLEYVRIHFVDSLGNAFIHLDDPPVLVDVRGRRPEKVVHADPGRLIEPSGLKVIHTLLTQDSAVEMPYRKIAGLSGVSLGSVGVVYRELQNSGFLIPISKDRWKLDRRPALIEHFVRGYELKLRPSIHMGRFRHTLNDPERLAGVFSPLLRHVRGGSLAGVLTGALAEQNLHGGHLLADSLVAFVKPQARQDLLKTEPMLPDEESGNLTLLKWYSDSIQVPDHTIYDLYFATDLMIYAELLHDGRPRELEAAERMRLKLEGARDSR